MKTVYPVLVLFLMLLSTQSVQAQSPASSLGDLQTRLHIGDKLQVIDRNGKKTEGRFDGASAASLSLIAKGGRHEFVESQIREVKKRRSESAWDGVLYGLGIGAVAGIVNVKVVCSGASERDDCLNVGWLIIVPLFAGGGAGTGALIDRAISHHDSVFASAVRSNYRLRLSPILDRQRKGAGLSFSF